MRLADELRKADIYEALVHVPRQEMVARCENAIKRFASEDQSLLHTEQLDAWSRQVWDNMSLKSKLWRGTQPLAVMLAPLLAAVLVPLDAGGTAVLVFASAKELLAAAGVAAVMTPLATGGEALQIVHRETPWRQLSDLFAILCDALGIARPDDADLPTSICDSEPRRLLASGIQPRACGLDAALQVWEPDEDTLQQLQILARQNR
jgi:hypothetical protein